MTNGEEHGAAAEEQPSQGTLGDVRRAQRAGDDGSWASLSKRILERLEPFRGRPLPAGADFDDFVAEVFAHVLRDLPSLEVRSRGEFWAWLQKLALRRWIDVRRRAQAMSRRGGVGSGDVTGDPRGADPAPDPSPTAIVRGREISSALQQCIDRLENATQRAVFELRHREGLSADEIAARLDRKASTVRSDLKRARDQVHECLRRRLDGYSSLLPLAT